MIQLHFLACCQQASRISTPRLNPGEHISLSQLVSISWVLPFIPGHILGHWSSYSSITLGLLSWHGPMSMSPSIHWFLQKMSKAFYLRKSYNKSWHMFGWVNYPLPYMIITHLISTDSYWCQDGCTCPLKSVLPFNIIVIEILFNMHMTDMTQR